MLAVCVCFCATVSPSTTYPPTPNMCVLCVCMWTDRLVSLCEGLSYETCHVLVLQSLHTLSVHGQDQLAYLQSTSFVRCPVLLQ